MRRFILSILLLGAILGAGHLLNHITAHDAVMNVASYTPQPSDSITATTATGHKITSGTDSVAVTLTQYLHD